MIVVAYNPSKLSTDGYAQCAAKARYKIEVTTVKSLAEGLASYKDHSIQTLIIADHGMKGVQGVGSGQTHDCSYGKNFNAEYLKASSTPVTGEPIVGSDVLGPMPMMAFLMKAAEDSLPSTAQTGYFAVIGKKLKIGGNLLLNGCSVGKGDKGASLLKSIGLTLQNSIKVVAAVCDTSFTDTTKPVIYPARDGGGFPRLSPSDVVGYMGMRQLNDDELQSVLDATDILSTGQ